MNIDNQLDGLIRQALTDAALTFAEAAADEAPVILGNLQHSIHVGKLEVANGVYSIDVGIDPAELPGDVNYAPYVHNGTGIYGPKKQRITPKTARALKTPYGWKTSIAGQKANPFFTRAWDNNQEKILAKFRQLVSDGFVKFRLIDSK